LETGRDTVLGVNDYKLAYNILLKRYNNAEKYFETHSEEEINRWLPLATEIINNMGIIIEALQKRFNVEVSGDEIEHGFILEEKKE
jgi:predicted methyltransferase